METFFKNYFWTVNLLALTAAAWLTATTVNEYVSDKLFAGAEASKPAGAKATESAPFTVGGDDGQDWSTVLMARNVFNAERTDKAPEPPREPVEVPEEPLDDDGEIEDSELDIALVGTLVAADPMLSMATVKLSGSGKLVRIGTDLKRTPDAESILARVLEIHRRHIIILEGGKKKRVRLWGDRTAGAQKPGVGGRFDRGVQRPGMPTAMPTPQPSVGGEKTDYAQGVRKVSMYKYEVDRSMIEEELNDLSELGRQARIVPNYRNGQYQGFKLIGVRPGSLYRALGIRSGDIIQRVNGQEINSPNKAIQLFEELRSQRNIALDIERRGQKRTLQYDMK
jgi:general secretion pathway protein C